MGVLLNPPTPVGRYGPFSRFIPAAPVLASSRVNKWSRKFKDACAQCRDFLDEKALATVNRAQLSRLHKFAHFWLLVVRSFSRNRCPVRASALAYTTLLALIPTLFLAV